MMAQNRNGDNGTRIMTCISGNVLVATTALDSATFTLGIIPMGLSDRNE